MSNDRHHPTDAALNLLFELTTACRLARELAQELYEASQLERAEHPSEWDADTHHSIEKRLAMTTLNEARSQAAIARMLKLLPPQHRMMFHDNVNFDDDYAAVIARGNEAATLLEGLLDGKVHLQRVEVVEVQVGEA